MKKKRKTTKNKARKKSSSLMKGISPSKPKQLVTTTTGEIFQPIRLHYMVPDPALAERTILSLECMDTDPVLKRLVWLYMKEASSIQFNKVPKTSPIIIGEFFLNGNEEIILNVRSIERALAAVEFFDLHIPRSIAKLTHLTVINRLFSVGEMENVTSLQTLFEQTPLTEIDPNDLMVELMTAKEQSKNDLDKYLAIDKVFEKRAKRPKPDMEKFPTNYYEDGITPLRIKLLLQQNIAMQHWKGNIEYTAQNALQNILQLSLQK